MPSAVSVKAGAAFLAGVVVALGSAFIYFKAADNHPHQTAQVSTVPAPAASATDLSASNAPLPPIEKAPAPAPVPAAAPAPAEAKPVVARQRRIAHPVSMAVRKARSAPASTSTAPANNPTETVVAQNVPAVPAPLPVDVPAPAPQVPEATPPAPAPQPHVITLPAGTSVAIRLAEKLSTDHNYAGDTFRATLDNSIIMDGFIIAEKGSKVLGRIVKADKPGKFSGLAELSLVLTELNTTDGQRVPVHTNESLRKGPSNTNEEVVKMGGGAALGAIIGAIAGGGKGAAIGAGAGGAAGTGAVLLGRGKPAVINDETRLTFQLSEPTTITEKLN
jgi:hypothetical protein